ncbi:MAG: hypothetical protein EOO21_01190 [Comamonadaceae bacterium]|nr:MAG: hypothetical protein EOO21_01190 [Comamonadaceae bacterium]
MDRRRRLPAAGAGRRGPGHPARALAADREARRTGHRRGGASGRARPAHRCRRPARRDPGRRKPRRHGRHGGGPSRPHLQAAGAARGPVGGCDAVRVAAAGTGDRRRRPLRVVAGARQQQADRRVPGERQQGSAVRLREAAGRRGRAPPVRQARLRRDGYRRRADGDGADAPAASLRLRAVAPAQHLRFAGLDAQGLHLRGQLQGRLRGALPRPHLWRRPHRAGRPPGLVRRCRAAPAERRAARRTRGPGGLAQRVPLRPDARTARRHAPHRGAHRQGRAALRRACPPPEGVRRRGRHRRRGARLRRLHPAQRAARALPRVPATTSRPDPRRIRSAGVTARPAIPYEDIARVDRIDAAYTADTVLANGWVLGSYPAVSLQRPLPWTLEVQAERSLNFHLHSWDPVESLLQAHSATGEARYLEAAVRVATEWVRAHPPDEPADASPFAWYDMAVGLRSYRLAYILDAATQCAILAEPDRDALSDALERLPERRTGTPHKAPFLYRFRE